MPEARRQALVRAVEANELTAEEIAREFSVGRHLVGTIRRHFEQLLQAGAQASANDE